jgi:hypothetical protein
MWIIKRVAGADTYYTGRDRTPWSSEMKDACVYGDLGEIEEAMITIDYPLGDIEVTELPDPGRYSNRTAKRFA